MEGYLVPIDGTGVFYSDKVHCKHCCERHHQDGSISYYHQLLVATMVHPDYKPVLPLSCESICREDGMKKNDCELNASQRLIEKLRHQHPQLPMILVEDALYANGPHIRALRKAKMRHITVVKPKDHTWLFDWVKASKKNILECSGDGKKHLFEWVNDVPLSDKRSDVKVNFLEYFETDAKGKIHHWTWVTDLPLQKDTVYQIMKGGRARWRIENETFNTLKNQGYEFEHNFGHGHKHLTDVFARLMLLAFLIDQAQLLACPLFKKALDRVDGIMKELWDRQKFLFLNCLLDSWDMMFRALIERPKLIMQFDTG
jgi:hypothetical protein